MKYVRAQWDRVAAVAAVLLGALLLYLGWDGVRGTAYPAEQLPYIVSGGLGGMLLVGVGAALWLSADLRDEWRKLDSLEQAVREHLGRTVEAGVEPPAEQAPPAANGVAVDTYVANGGTTNGTGAVRPARTRRAR